MQYTISGEPLPVVICNLDDGEAMNSESGAMAWMSTNMQMETVGGGLGKVFGRMASGESVFLNRYTARGPGMIAFASSFAGSIKAIKIAQGRQVVVQKSGFLAATEGVELSVFFQRKGMSGFFGGEGFIMQKLSGNGLAFIEIDGSVVEYDLAPGQQLIVDTGYVAMMDASCKMEVQAVKGVKNALFGGEGLFNTIVTGPGHIMLQTMPISAFARTIAGVLPTKN